jgi:hypothetical protein
MQYLRQIDIRAGQVTLVPVAFCFVKLTENRVTVLHTSEQLAPWIFILHPLSSEVGVSEVFRFIGNSDSMALFGRQMENPI